MIRIEFHEVYFHAGFRWENCISYRGAVIHASSLTLDNFGSF